MKLASLKSETTPHGELVVVDKTLTRATFVPHIAHTLIDALTNWNECEPRLGNIYQLLNCDRCPNSFPFSCDTLSIAAPLPRATQFLDGSAFLPHIERVRRARGINMEDFLSTHPLMYQGDSEFLGPFDRIEVENESWGIDFEGEIAIITDRVPMGITPERAHAHIKLFMLLNDVSLRNLIPEELKKGFGFVHGKPQSACSPVAVTPDELGGAWDDKRVHLSLITHYRGLWFGAPNAGEMHFDFPTLISHAAKTRYLGIGTVIGSGTISNQNQGGGFSCIVEKRAVESLQNDIPITPFMSFGTRVHMMMHDKTYRQIFGSIHQEVRQYINPYKKEGVESP